MELTTAQIRNWFYTFTAIAAASFTALVTADIYIAGTLIHAVINPVLSMTFVISLVMAGIIGAFMHQQNIELVKTKDVLEIEVKEK